MQRVLIDSQGRRLVLPDGVLTSGNVLVVQGEPLIQLEEADVRVLPPALMDANAASVPGVRIEVDASSTRASIPGIRGSARAIR